MANQFQRSGVFDAYACNIALHVAKLNIYVQSMLMIYFQGK